MSSSVEQYPQLAYFTVLEDSSLNMGSYVTTGGDLQLAVVTFYHREANPYSYQLRLVGSASLAGPALFASDWVEFSNDTTGQASEHFLGEIAFDFTPYSLLSGESYHLRIEQTGYTRDGEVSYLAFKCDWLEPIGVANTAGVRVAMGVLQ